MSNNTTQGSIEPRDPQMPAQQPQYHRWFIELRDAHGHLIKIKKADFISMLHKFQRNSKDSHICMLLRSFFVWVAAQREAFTTAEPTVYDKGGMPSTLKGAITNVLNRYLITLFEEGLVLHFTKEEQVAMVASYCAATHARDTEDWTTVANCLCEVQAMCIGYTRGRMGSLARAAGKTLFLHEKHVEMTTKEVDSVKSFHDIYRRYESKGLFTGSKTALPLLEKCLRVQGFDHLLPLLELKCAECAEVRRVMCMTALVADDIAWERPEHKLDTPQEQDTATLIGSIPALINELGVRDEHVTGKKGGKLPVFTSLGCRVSPETSMQLYGLDYKTLEEIYITEKELDCTRKASNATVQAPPAAAPSKPKSSKKRPPPPGDKPAKKQSTLGPDWAGGVVRRLKSKIERNGTDVFVAMASPVVEGIRLSDAKGLNGPEEAKELLEVLLYRGMIATGDTNAFNFMRLDNGGILSVDENPMPGNNKLVVGDPRIKRHYTEMVRMAKYKHLAEDMGIDFDEYDSDDEYDDSDDEDQQTEEEAVKRRQKMQKLGEKMEMVWAHSSLKHQYEDSPFMEWLQTAQRINANFMIPVYQAARDHPEIVKNFLERFRDAYRRYKAVLQETYSQQERANIDERHRRIYSQFGVGLEAGEPPPISRVDVQGTFEECVAQVIPRNGIIDQQQLNLERAVCLGFKNASLVGEISGPPGSTECIRAFIKIGEPAHSASFSKASAQLRRDLGLSSVPVRPVNVRVTDPEAFGPAATRGRDRHYARANL